MRLTKSTSHAIRILIDCARAGDRLTKVAELSQRLQITQQNVFKIVNLLARAGLIEAMRRAHCGPAPDTARLVREEPNAGENKFVTLKLSTQGMRIIDKRGIEVVLSELRARGVKV